MSDPADGARRPETPEVGARRPRDQRPARLRARRTHVRPYVDLGGVKILPRPELRLRLEVEEGSQRVVAVALDYAGSTLQVQPFAAPRNERAVARDPRPDRRPDRAPGRHHRRPSRDPSAPRSAPRSRRSTAARGHRLARFIGVDGPRWFLRGVISGQAPVDPEAAAKVEDLFRSIVVVRGNTPMPPRDLIPLHVPAAVQGSGPAQSV